MNYPAIQPPFKTLKFREIPKKDLKDYHEWFHQIMPERIEILNAAVQSTPGYETWEADRSPQSLEPLGKWFLQQVEIRPRTHKEIDEIFHQHLGTRADQQNLLPCNGYWMYAHTPGHSYQAHPSWMPPNRPVVLCSVCCAAAGHSLQTVGQSPAIAFMNRCSITDTPITRGEGVWNDGEWVPGTI